MLHPQGKGSIIWAHVYGTTRGTVISIQQVEVREAAICPTRPRIAPPLRTKRQLSLIVSSAEVEKSHPREKFKVHKY